MRRVPHRLARLSPLIALLLMAGSTFAIAPADAASPSSGSIGPNGPSLNWTGTATGGAATGESDCVEGLNCDTFTLTVAGQPADWSGKLVGVTIGWQVPTNDYDLYIHRDSNAGPVVGSSGSGAPSTTEQAVINPSTGTGVYTVHVVYFSVTPLVDQYHGTAEVIDQQGSEGDGTGPAPAFDILPAPPGVADDAGEPSIGLNPSSGNAMFQAGLDTLRVSFDDSASPATATWTDVSAPTSLTSLDPILFTDQYTGRTFVSQLAGTTSLMSYSDDDGETWVPTQGGGIASGVDHQTVGGGPFHEPLTRDPDGDLYPDAVYYCSQDVAAALCASSLDGGLTFGPAIPIYSASECAGLHGHVKVAPDGTVYVPNKNCGGKQGVVVSEDNGLTWTVRTIPGSLAGDTDPSIGIGADGTIYVGLDNGDGRPHIAVSRDRGATWASHAVVGRSFGVVNTVFPAVVAGDDDRAAFAFYGSDSTDTDQVWYLYVASTYDGGTSWVTVNATPDDPIQRGEICTGGISCGENRNLLDFFDATVDAEGRILVGYDDGCVGACVDGPPNSFTAKGTIARQSSGPRLFAAFDPAPAADLALTMSDKPDPVKTGNDLIYTLVVRNNGPDAASDAVLSDHLPSGVKLKSATGTQGTCAASGKKAVTVTCGLGDIGPGGSVTVSIVVKTSKPGIIANSASVVAGAPDDPVTANNSATETTTVGR